MRFFLHAGLVLCATLPLSAAVVINTTVNAAIPDDSSTGLFSQVNVSTVDTVDSVTVSLHISAAGGSQAFLGDLYAYLQHDSGISVLLNRPGRRGTESFGYDDDQTLNVTLADGGNDIHNYRADDNIALTGSLTGSWAPDGRITDPSQVLSSDPSVASLGAAFHGVPTQGNWRLFVADLSGGSVHQFDEWTLTLNTTAVPEPETLALLAGLTLVSFGVGRKILGK